MLTYIIDSIPLFRLEVVNISDALGDPSSRNSHICTRLRLAISCLIFQVDLFDSYDPTHKKVHRKFLSEKFY